MRMRMAMLAAAGVLTGHGPALAQDAPGPVCGPFTLERTLGSMTFVDLGAEGKSPGDQRIIRNTLTDPDGNEVGSINIVSTLLSDEGPDGEDLTLANAVVDLTNGTLSVVTLLTVPAADQSPGPGKPNESAVTGGTGAFANANGVMITTTRDDGARELRFEIACD